MKTLLVHGKEQVPDSLRVLVQRGSTTVDEISASDLKTFVSREALGVDRIVFWAGVDDDDIRTLAWNYATAESEEMKQAVVFITGHPSETAFDGISPDNLFIWPRDEDKLTVMFTTAG